MGGIIESPCSVELFSKRVFWIILYLKNKRFTKNIYVYWKKKKKLNQSAEIFTDQI